jgi:hypothetical protein
LWNVLFPIHLPIRVEAIVAKQIKRRSTQIKVRKDIKTTVKGHTEQGIIPYQNNQKFNTGQGMYQHQNVQKVNKEQGMF